MLNEMGNIQLSAKPISTSTRILRKDMGKQKLCEVKGYVLHWKGFWPKRAFPSAVSLEKALYRIDVRGAWATFQSFCHLFIQQGFFITLCAGPGTR